MSNLNWKKNNGYEFGFVFQTFAIKILFYNKKSYIIT